MCYRISVLCFYCVLSYQQVDQVSVLVLPEFPVQEHKLYCLGNARGGPCCVL